MDDIIEGYYFFSSTIVGECRDFCNFARVQIL